MKHPKSTAENVVRFDDWTGAEFLDLLECQDDDFDIDPRDALINYTDC